MMRKNIEMGVNPTRCITFNTIKLSYGDTGSSDKHYVLWSGGTDSTLCLYELLELYGVDNVIAVSFIYPWLDHDKVENERSHRKAIKEKLRLQLSLPKEIIHMEMTISAEMISGDYVSLGGGGLPQAVAWLSTIGLYVPDGGYVYCGAIKNDDLTVHMEPYHKMFEGIAGTLDRDITLREPYIMMEKYQVLDKLFQYGLYDVTWHCEMPQGLHKPCLKCIPCLTHQSALIMLTMNGSSEMIKFQAQKELDKIRKLLAEHPTENKQQFDISPDVTD